MKHYTQIYGWFTEHDRSKYIEAVNTFKDEDIFVEIGSFEGRSSVAMAELIKYYNKKIKFYCVDTWLGSEEHQQGHFSTKEVIEGTLYDKFLKNINEYEDIINPIRLSSIDAAKTFEDKSLSFIFIDAAHDYENVTNDLNAWYPKIKDNGIFSGHDWSWSSVASAVSDFCKLYKLSYQAEGNVWRIMQSS